MHIKLMPAHCFPFCWGLNMKFFHGVSTSSPLFVDVQQQCLLILHDSRDWSPTPQHKRQPAADQKWSCPSRLESWLETRPGLTYDIWKMNTVYHWIRACMTYNIKWILAIIIDSLMLIWYCIVYTVDFLYKTFNYNMILHAILQIFLNWVWHRIVHCGPV